MNVLKHLRAAGALRHQEALDAARQAADWAAIEGALIAAKIEPAGAVEIVRRLRMPNATPLSMVPVDLDAACAAVQSEYPDVAADMTPELWTAFRRSLAEEGAAAMRAVRALQRCRPAVVVEALLPWPPLARAAKAIVREYVADGAEKPGAVWKDCRNTESVE